MLTLLLGLVLMLAGLGSQATPRRTCAILVATAKVPEYRLTTLGAGVRFDVAGDGVPEQTAWIENVYDVAYLAIDRNGNGTIDNGRELVGGQAVPEASNGFSALERFAPRPEDAWASSLPTRHNDAFLDASDAIWTSLFLWHDLNRNAVSEPAELKPVGDLLTRIGLGYSRWNKRDTHDNLWVWRGWVELKQRLPDEPFRRIYDVACRTK